MFISSFIMQTLGLKERGEGRHGGVGVGSGSPSQSYRQRVWGATKVQRINVGLCLVDPASRGHWCSQGVSGGRPVTSEKGRLRGPRGRGAASGQSTPGSQGNQPPRRPPHLPGGCRGLGLPSTPRTRRPLGGWPGAIRRRPVDGTRTWAQSA